MSIHFCSNGTVQLENPARGALAGVDMEFEFKCHFLSLIVFSIVSSGMRGGFFSSLLETSKQKILDSNYV